MSGPRNSRNISNSVRAQRLESTVGTTRAPSETYDEVPTSSVDSAPTALSRLISFIEQFGILLTLVLTLGSGFAAFVIFSSDLDTLKSDVDASKNKIEVNQKEVSNLDTNIQLMGKDIRQLDGEVQSIYKISDNQSNDIRELRESQLKLEYSLK